MTYNKEIIVSFAGLLAIAALSSARPNQNEQLVSRSASPFSQVASSKVPWSPARNGGVMYLPEINAFLVPAEGLLHAAASQAVAAHAPVMAPQHAPRRRRPIANYIKYVNNLPPSGTYQPTAETKNSYNDGLLKGQSNSEVNVNSFYGTGVEYFSTLPHEINTYEDMSPKMSHIDRTLTENDRLLEKISENLDETMLLMGQAGQGTRLTLRPIAKAVAGPRGVAVASPIAQAVLRRKDPAPEISYEPDSVAVAGPGGQAYSHPKLVVTYLDEPELTNNSTLSPESAEQTTESILLNQQDTISNTN